MNDQIGNFEEKFPGEHRRGERKRRAYEHHSRARRTPSSFRAPITRVAIIVKFKSSNHVTDHEKNYIRKNYCKYMSRRFYL